MEFNVSTTGLNVTLEDIGVSLLDPQTVNLLDEGLGFSDILDSRDLEAALESGTLIADDGDGRTIDKNNIGSFMGRVLVNEGEIATKVSVGDNVSQLVNDELYIKEIDLTADAVQVTPVGNLTSTDAQAALEELQADIDTLGTGVTLVLTWQFRSETGAADPGNGRFRLNNSDPALATEIYLDSQTSGGADVSTILNAFNENSRFYVQETGDSGRFIVAEITSITDNFGWFTLAITVVDSGIAFQQNRDCSFIFVQAPSSIVEPEIGDLTTGEYTSAIEVANYPTTWQDVPFENIALENNTDVIQQDPANDDRIILKETGLYLCQYSTNVDDNLLGRIRINDVTIPIQSYGAYGSTIDAADIAGLLTQTFTFEATAGDFITLQQRAESTFENTIAKNGVTSTLTVVRMAGAKGAKGDQGDPGASGGDFNDGGDSEGADRSLGNNDNFALALKTNGLDRITIQADGDVDLEGNNIKNLFDPIDSQDAATKSYVDDLVLDQFIEATLTNNQQLPASTAFQDIDGFDIPPAALNTITGLVFNNATGEITCTEVGVYRVDFNTTLDQYDGNNRTSGVIRMTLNGSLVKGTQQWGYHRQLTEGYDNYSFTKTVELIPGDVLQIQARNTDATREQQLLADSTLIRITRLKN